MIYNQGSSGITIASVVGARPQFVKAAVVSRALRSMDGITEILVHTGQHYDDSMSGVFFRELDIPEPDYNLEIGSGLHGQQTGMMLQKIEQVLIERRPDWMLVYGDTNSTLAGALAASKLHIPVAHVEAGLRSYNRSMPEEINRILTDCISDLLFTPTNAAVTNLLSEGVSEHRIKQVGDVMYDAALYYGAMAESKSTILNDIRLEPGGYILATVHRADNTDSPLLLQNILDGLSEVSRQINVVLPVHPRTRAAIMRLGWQNSNLSGFKMIEPATYLDMLMLEKSSKLVVTDSGGVQKEASFFKVPCIVLRTETEWVELLESGQNKLCPPESADVITSTLMGVLNSKSADYVDCQPYGTGNAGQAIAQTIYGLR